MSGSDHGRRCARIGSAFDRGGRCGSRSAMHVLDLKLIKWETLHTDTTAGTVIPLRGTAEE